MADERERALAEEGQGEPVAAGQQQAQDSQAGPALESTIEELTARNEDLLDKYRRSLAEFANYRKRQDREREQHAWHTRAQVVRRLLDPLDDFARALASVPAEHADSPWVTGVALIDRKLRQLLEEYDVRPIEALGKPFDPNYHSALMQEHSADFPEGAVMEEIQTGYTMSGQVLRPTVVKVSAGPANDQN
jgi:molecular chaperone GrpE